MVHEELSGKVIPNAFGMKVCRASAPLAGAGDAPALQSQPMRLAGDCLHPCHPFTPWDNPSYSQQTETAFAYPTG
jgi:hypothetical protein